MINKPQVELLAAGDEAKAFAIESACLDTAWSEKQIAESIKNGNIYLVFRLDDGGIAGIISAVTACGECEIMNLAVLEKYRKNGVGSALLNKLEADAKSKNAEKLFLEVAESNITALAFYKKHGFNCVGRRKGFYRGADALIMEKKI